jgi:alkylhydroperoxidase/carboxymuconolactone decarboxylase family protein YurZ
MSEDRPVLDTLAVMTAASIENSNLGARELMLSRIAALAAVGAPAVSYLANVGAAVDSGVTLEDVQGVLAAVAPIIGTARTVTAAANVSRALGFVILALEEELQAELVAEAD